MNTIILWGSFALLVIGALIFAKSSLLKGKMSSIKKLSSELQKKTKEASDTKFWSLIRANGAEPCFNKKILLSVSEGKLLRRLLSEYGDTHIVLSKIPVSSILSSGTKYQANTAEMKILLLSINNIVIDFALYSLESRDITAVIELEHDYNGDLARTANHIERNRKLDEVLRQLDIKSTRLTDVESTIRIALI